MTNPPMQFEVAGVKFRLASFVRANVTYGDKLTLKPEPTNEFDPNAIGVYKGEHHIGYVPRGWTQALVPVETVGCVVCSVWGKGCSVNATRLEDGQAE